MAPVATTSAVNGMQRSKETIFNPFYSPSVGDDGDQGYEYAKYKVAVMFRPKACFQLETLT